MKKSMEKKKFIWVIEMYYKDWYKKWQPCSGCGITEENAKEILKSWQELNPHERFRIKKYSA